MTQATAVIDQFAGSGGLVDVHTHLLPRAYVETLLRHAAYDPGLERAASYVRTTVPEKLPPACGRNLFGSALERLADLDKAGIAAQIISAGSLLSFPAVDEQRRIALVQAWNDAVHEESRSAPERFRVFAALTLPDVEGALAEVERVRDRSTTAGFNLTTHVGGIPLDDGRWWPLYERLDELSATVFVHPDGFFVKGLFDRELDIDLGTQLEDTLTVVRMYRSGILERFPRIQWVIPHLGGAISAVLERLDEHWERDHAHRALPDFPSRSLGTLLFDTAGHGPKAIAFAAEVLGASRLVFGTDFPMVSAETLVPLVASFRETLDARPGFLAAILGNGERILAR